MMQFNQRSIGNMRFGYLGYDRRVQESSSTGTSPSVRSLPVACLLSFCCLLSSVRSRFRRLCYCRRLFRCSVATGRFGRAVRSDLFVLFSAHVTLCFCRCILAVQLTLQSSVTNSKTSRVSKDHYKGPQKRKHEYFTRTNPFQLKDRLCYVFTNV